MITIDKRKLNKLKGDLKGHLIRLAAMEKVNISTISRVLDGKIDNPRLLNSAIEYRNELLRKKSAIEAQI